MILNFKIKQVRIFSLIFFLLLLCYVGVRYIKLPIRQSSTINENHEYLMSKFELLDKDKIYFADVVFSEVGTLPFKKGVYETDKNIINVYTTFPQQKVLLESLNLPLKDTWKYICSDNGIEILSYQGYYYDFYIRLIEEAVFRHMVDRYKKRIKFKVAQNLGYLKSYKCETLGNYLTGRKYDKR